MNKNRLWWAEVKGTTEILLRLLVGPDYTSKFYKSEINPEGVGSPNTVSQIIKVLLRLGLIKRNTKQMRPRVYLKLTGIGIDVAHHLKIIEEILQSSTKP